VLREDGHPSIGAADAAMMVTDTYPNRLGEQTLLVFDMTTNTAQNLARFYSPRGRGETRCDLHPRWDFTGRRIAVDSAHNGERRLCVVHLGA
jgi:hypothetical protein